MDVSTIQSRQNILTTPTSSQRTERGESTEGAAEARTDNNQDDNSKVSNETVTLSDTSLKLSSSTPVVKSSNKSAPIENQVQAQQSLNQLVTDFQNNPAQARGAHSSINSTVAAKALLG